MERVRLTIVMINFALAGLNVWAAIALDSPAVYFGVATFCFGMGICMTNAEWEE